MGNIVRTAAESASEGSKMPDTEKPIRGFWNLLRQKIPLRDARGKNCCIHHCLRAHLTACELVLDQHLLAISPTTSQAFSNHHAALYETTQILLEYGAI
ncbi:hypothetical protein E2P81_ATG03467 [Venturia nashicola]|nr:hypothetical protein E2P81_ATG03467 [Venturia nashicola]